LSGGFFSSLLEAAKWLGWESILCVEFCGDKADARQWETAENLYRAELTALDRAERIDLLRTLFLKNAEVGQPAPPGGRQPNYAGSAKALGLTREDVRRSKRIVGISREAKAKVREFGLEDNQGALLTIAKQLTPKMQLRVIDAIVERKRAARARQALLAAERAGDDNSAEEMRELEADIGDKMSRVRRINDKMATKRKRLHELQAKVVALSNELEDQPMDEEEDFSESSPIVPAESSDSTNENKFETLKSRWLKHLADDWTDTNSAVRARFIVEVLEYPALPVDADNGSED
jgi:hypothetical protein